MPLALLRPDAWDLPLFLHVLGAMALIGTLLLTSTALVVAWRRADEAEAVPLRRLGFRTLLLGVLPSYLLMRIAGQWTEARENLSGEQEDAAWLTLGYITTDVGALLIAISLVLAGLALWRGWGRRVGNVIGAVATVLLVVYVVVVWAMTTKLGA